MKNLHKLTARNVTVQRCNSVPKGARVWKWKLIFKKINALSLQNYSDYQTFKQNWRGFLALFCSFLHFNTCCSLRVKLRKSSPAVSTTSCFLHNSLNTDFLTLTIHLNTRDNKNTQYIYGGGGGGITRNF